MQKNTTIAAISTPMGVGGIGMVRLSGPEAIGIAGRLFRPIGSKRLADAPGYTSLLGRVFGPEGDVDDAIAFVYRAPRSYTGEDIVELSSHGGIWVVQQVLRLCLEMGAKPAGPGEFTMRAFQSGKMSLSQAESVIDIINAQSSAALKAALAGRDGVLTGEISALADALKGESAHLAAWADFPEEDLEPVDEAVLAEALRGHLARIRALLATWDKGKILRDGIATAIVGRPNVGKSTLMNLLAGDDRSIVTDIPGTTRDIVQESVRLGNFVLHLADTAGIHDTNDPVESIGVERSKRQIELSDLVLAVFDSSDELTDHDRELITLLGDKPCIGIVNKIDLETRIDLALLRERLPELVVLSARTGEGRAELEDAIAGVLKLRDFDPAAAIVANERQRACMARAGEAVEEAIQALEDGVTLDAVNISIDSALDQLLSLTGQKVGDTVVHEVFSRFCVGK